MEAPRIRRTVAAVLALATAACAGATGSSDGSAPGPPTASTERLEAIYRARMDSARMEFTGADVHFVTGMIGHHAQAILMSRLVPERTDNPAIQTLAARIINAQKGEIALMEQWLEERGQPVPDLHIDETALTVHGAGHAMDMAGMLTPEQLRELERARGTAFDRLFLAGMIQHHSGAVAMVHDLFATDGAAQDEKVFRIASDIQVDQITEIARMESMLAELPPADGPL